MHRVAPVKADMKEAETEEHGEGSGPIKPTPSEGESSSVSRALLNEEEEVPLSVVFYTLTKLHNKYVGNYILNGNIFVLNCSRVYVQVEIGLEVDPLYGLLYPLSHNCFSATRH